MATLYKKQAVQKTSFSHQKIIQDSKKGEIFWVLVEFGFYTVVGKTILSL